MPSAPNSRARLASAGVSAFVRIFSVRYLSAQFITVAKSPESFGVLRGDRAGHHFAGRAVDRERVLVGERLAADLDLAALLVDVDLRRRRRRSNDPNRGRRPPRGWSCRRCW